MAAGAARDGAGAPGYGSLPLAFEPNEGQTDPSVAYLAHGQGYTAFLTQDGITLALAPLTGTAALADPARLRTPRLRGATTTVSGPALRLQLVGASTQAQVQATDPLPGTVNYLLGSDPSTWHTGIPTFGQVTYPDVYPGVDLVYHGQENNLALDFVVHPGAQVGAIRLQLAGVSGAAPNSAGDLVIGAGGATLRALQPGAYQDIAGQRHTVGAHYHLLGGDAVGLTLDSYDTTQPVTIDPVLVYSSYQDG